VQDLEAGQRKHWQQGYKKDCEIPQICKEDAM